MNKPHRNVVGAEVRRRRKQLRWSQSRLANHLQLEGLDLSRSSLAKVECGMVWVGDFELLYFARVLGIRVQDLFPKIGAEESLSVALTTFLGSSPDALKKKAHSSALPPHNDPRRSTR
jgi:transcriptional regulator with XRE-family HTH domain